MNSVVTEKTEYREVPAVGWIFYDRACASCSAWAERFTPVFANRGFLFAPLQEPSVPRALGLPPAEILAEMRVLTRDGSAFAGADAIVYLTQHIWWMSPLSWFAKLPGAKRVLQSLYRWVAARRRCDVRDGEARARRPLTCWLPLVSLPFLALLAKPFLPAWGFMWAMVAALYGGCKWLTLSLAHTPGVCPFRAAAYLIAWPGMDAARFLSPTTTERLHIRELLKTLLSAVTRMLLGALLLFAMARHASDALLAGWIGMVGMVLILHFGVFDLASIAWRALRVNATPIMSRPLHSTSVGEFWGRRWNGAFNLLALSLVFRPAAHRLGTTTAILLAFGVSGLVHELVISLPANAGFGLPIAYFTLQGTARLAEHSNFGRRAGLGRGVRGRLFTMLIVAAPAFWLFHPPFVRRVIVPFMQAIGAL